MQWEQDQLHSVSLLQHRTVSDTSICQQQKLLSTSPVGPDDAPRDFTSTPTITDVTFNWRIPATPNGIITQYNLTVVNLDTPNTTSYIIDVTSNQQQVSQLVTGFKPYENYTATVTGTTLVGYGPVAVTKGRTRPDSKYYTSIQVFYHLIVLDECKALWGEPKLRSIHEHTWLVQESSKHHIATRSFWSFWSFA